MPTNKIILDLAITLDGYIEGPNGEVDWCIRDEEMNFNHFLDQIDTIIYGRKSYDLWGEFMPNLKDDQFGDKMMWDQIHSKQKFVFTNQNYNDKAHWCPAAGSVTYWADDGCSCSRCRHSC